MKSKLRVMSIVAIFVLCFMSAGIAKAGKTKVPTLMHMKENYNSMIVENHEIIMEENYREACPFKQDGLLYVPVKFIASGMNGTCTYVKKTNKTTIKIDQTTFVFTKDSKTAVINKKKVTMKGKAVMKETFLYVPANVFVNRLKTTNVTIFGEECIIFRSKASEESYTEDHQPIGGCVPSNRSWSETLKNNGDGKKVEKIADEIIKKIIQPGMSDLEKVMAVNDYLVENSTTINGQFGIYGPLLNGNGVCEGYANSAELLINKAGVPCTLVLGYAGCGSEDYTNDILDALRYSLNRHAWNLVKIDGKWYHLDVTWDDAQVNNKDSFNNMYNYFLLSDEQMAETHTWRRAFYEKAPDPFYNEKQIKELQSKGYPVITGTISTSDHSAAPKGGMKVTVASYGMDYSYEREYVIPEGKSEIPFSICMSKKFTADEFLQQFRVTTTTRGFEEQGNVISRTASDCKVQMMTKQVNLLTGKMILPEQAEFMSDYRYSAHLYIYEKIEGQNGMSMTCDQTYFGTAKPGQKELYFDWDAAIPTREYEYEVFYTIYDNSDSKLPVVRNGYLNEDGTFNEDHVYIRGSVVPLTTLQLHIPKADPNKKDPAITEVIPVKKDVKVTPTKEVRNQIIAKLKKYYVGNRSKLSKVTTLEQAQKLYDRKPDETSVSRKGDKSIYYHDTFENGGRLSVVYSLYYGQESMNCDATIYHLDLTSKNYMTILNELNTYVKSAVKSKKKAAFYVVDLSTYNAKEYEKKDNAAIYKKLMNGECDISASYEFGKKIYQITLRKNGSGELVISIGKF